MRSRVLGTKVDGKVTQTRIPRRTLLTEERRGIVALEVFDGRRRVRRVLHLLGSIATHGHARERNARRRIAARNTSTCRTQRARKHRNHSYRRRGSRRKTRRRRLPLSLRSAEKNTTNRRPSIVRRRCVIGSGKAIGQGQQCSHFIRFRESLNERSASPAYSAGMHQNAANVGHRTRQRPHYGRR